METLEAAAAIDKFSKYDEVDTAGHLTCIQGTLLSINNIRNIFQAFWLDVHDA